MCGTNVIGERDRKGEGREMKKEREREIEKERGGGKITKECT